MAGTLTGALEDNLLTLLCFSEKYAARVALEVKPEIFSTRAYQRIAAEAVTYLEKYHKPPRTHIRDLLERELTQGEGAAFMRQILDSMEALDKEIQPEYVLSKLSEFVETRLLTQAVEAAADLLHEGKLTEAREAISGGNRAVKMEGGVWLHDTEKFLDFLNIKDEDLFSSGIQALDDMGVRPARGELFMLTASAKRGKSWWLINAAKINLIEEHKHVLHITLENSLRITTQRYAQALLSLTRDEVAALRVPMLERDSLGRFSKFDFENLTPESVMKIGRKELTKRIKPFQSRGKLYIKSFPSGSLTIAQLNAFLDMLERTESFIPDIIILDYAQLMKIDSKNLRTSYGALMVDLRGVADERNVPILTVGQGSKIASSAKLVTGEHAAEAWSVIGTVDTSITYSQTPAERELGLARIFVSECRNAPDKWIALITQSIATGQFALDSCYFNKMVEGEVDKMTGEEEE